MLTDEQKKEFAKRGTGFGGFPLAGQLLAALVQERLKLTDDQKKQLAETQKEADGKLDTILKDAQKKQLKEMNDRMKAFTGGPPVGFPKGPGGGFGIPGGGFGAPGGGGVFRALRDMRRIIQAWSARP